MLPMLATSAARPPAGPQWRHEVKWDGMRILADVAGGRLRLSARSGADATNRFPELAGLARTYDDLLLDGEVVVLDAGIPSFAAVAERIHVTDRAAASALAARRPVTYLIFDVLRLFGTDLRDRPWHERRTLLEDLALDGPAWQVPATYDDGAALFAATREQGLEGVVSKRVDAVYSPGRRSGAWVKVPHRPLRSVVVGGWRPETNSASRVGALLVGVPRPDGLLSYLGKVGSGLAGAAQADVAPALDARAADVCPFGDEVPRPDRVGAHWVAPTLVVDVRSLGLAGQGRLRQPSYQLIRPDLTPADVAADVVAGQPDGEGGPDGHLPEHDGDEGLDV